MSGIHLAMLMFLPILCVALAGFAGMFHSAAKDEVRYPSENGRSLRVERIYRQRSIACAVASIVCLLVWIPALDLAEYVRASDLNERRLEFPDFTDWGCCPCATAQDMNQETKKP
jgi:archaellum biogenesis protein FlaJ (TadC family)